MQLVAGCVASGLVAGYKFLARPLGSDDNGVSARDNAFLQQLQQAIVAIKFKRNFRYECEVDVLAGNGRP